MSMQWSGSKPVLPTDTVLSVRQPYAQLLVSAGRSNPLIAEKWIENRSWVPSLSAGEPHWILIHAVHEESLLDAAMPDWDEINLNWDELQVLPKKWQRALQQWRGIYFIFDVSDGKGYVGSATGDDNILGRWKNGSTTNQVRRLGCWV